MNNAPSPFSCTFTPNIPELLNRLNCTIAISTYQAGKIVFLSAKNDEELIQLPRTFNKAMGITLQGDKMAIATKDEVIILVNSQGLAQSYPKQPGVYDGLFMPQAVYYTGQIDIHDLHWGDEGLWAVNTSFSCLVLINEEYHFMPKWKPAFISNLASEDRCHLNGMAIIDGKPKYVTTFGNGDSPQSWRENITKTGMVIDIGSGEEILTNLPMPHSPRFYDGKLYLLLSATGEVICAEPEKGRYEVVSDLSGFVRGMAKYSDYLFIGLSRLRKNSSTFKHLSIADKALNAGIKILHLPTGGYVGEIKYQSTVDEIYDVQIIPDIKRPGILNTYRDDYKKGLSVPGATYWAVKKEHDQEKLKK